MVATDQVMEIFADAKAVQAAALERLAAGDIRDAAEKAWCATKRATDALILARTGSLPAITFHTSSGLRALGQENDTLASLRSRYGNIVHHLHADCFYGGQCEPQEFFADLIGSVADYLQDAEGQATS